MLHAIIAQSIGGGGGIGGDATGGHSISSPTARQRTPAAETDTATVNVNVNGVSRLRTGAFGILAQSIGGGGGIGGDRDGSVAGSTGYKTATAAS